MKEFLKTVAEGYTARYAQRGDGGRLPLSEICFVFPNKRASTFFLKYLSALCEDYTLSPRVTNISDFVSEISGLEADNRLDQLLKLYRCYREIALEERPNAEPPGFDEFRIWGDTVLRDFSDVDMQMVDADSVFKNLKDFRNIATDFMTDEQKAVAEEYFGRSVYSHSENFWIEYDEEEADSSGAVRKYLRLWQVLNPLYHRFAASMELEGLSTAGGVYRRAAEILLERGSAGVAWRKIVFVGFNALSASERSIFSSLRDADSSYSRESGDTVADFVWDATGPVLKDVENPAGKFVAVNRRHFPEPSWLRPYLSESDTHCMPPYLERIACPSNAMQTKIAGSEIKSLKDEIGDAPFADAKVALVVPDEDLLIPLLYGLPPELESPNLTMGYPLRLTSVSTFMTLLRNLQMSQRNSREYRGYAVADIFRFLSHPLAHSVLGSEAIDRFKKEVGDSRRLVVREEEIERLLPAGMPMLRPLDMQRIGSGEVLEYLYNALGMVAESLERGEGRPMMRSLEHTHARTWQDALLRLRDALERNGVEMGAGMLFREADRMLSAETVPFEGEPLKGLQVMGLLETRSLDFDHVVIMSLNDNILPMRSRQRTFLPNSLRRAYGMAPANYQENIFSYYFYRLISRAKSVRMIYDSRVGESGGGKSRYLEQLEYLYARDSLRSKDYKMEVSVPSVGRKPVQKSDIFWEALQRYRADGATATVREGERRVPVLSASSLKKYCECRLKFLIEQVCGIRSDDKREPYATDLDLGDFYHHVMERLYVGDCKKDAVTGLLEMPVTVTAEKIESILADRKHIEAMIRREYNAVFNPGEPDGELTPAQLITARMTLLRVEATLRHDQNLAPFDLIGCEVGGTLVYTASSSADAEGEEHESLRLNMRFIIDRIDLVRGGETSDGAPVYKLRLIDYKTGRVDAVTADMDEIFSRMKYSNPSFQLMLYAELLSKWKPWKERYPHYAGSGIGQAMLVVYDVPRMNAGGEVKVPVFGRTPAHNYGEVREDFKSRLDAMLYELYDRDMPFAPVEDESGCEYCDLKLICRVAGGST